MAKAFITFMFCKADLINNVEGFSQYRPFKEGGSNKKKNEWVLRVKKSFSI